MLLPAVGFYFLFPNSIESTWKVVRQYDLLFLYRDCLDGTLRGYMLGGQEDREEEGKRYCVMRVCGTCFNTLCTGVAKVT